MTQEHVNTILLVEDDPDVARGVSIRLRASGYRVVHAADATEALILAARECPNLVILDVGLPGGDGHAVMDCLSRNMHTAAIPVVFLTARAQEETVRRAFEAGLLAMVESGLTAAA